METLNLGNPIFLTYMIAASIMIIKVASMSWLTVLHMIKVKGGYRSPEDIKKQRLSIPLKYLSQLWGLFSYNQDR
jgi:glutathione S-transferase